MLNKKDKMKIRSNLLYSLVILLLSGCTTNAQELTKRQESRIKRLFEYGSRTSLLFSSDEEYAELIHYEPENFFYKSLSKNDMEKCTNLIQETANIKIEHDTINKISELLFEADLIENVNRDDEFRIGIKILENNLLIDKDTLPLKKQSSTNYGNGKIEIMKPLSEIIDSTKVSGYIKCKINYLSGYEQITLTKNDIGQTFNLDTFTFKLLEVTDNLVFIDCVNYSGKNFGMVNFASNGKAVVHKFCKEDLEKAQEKKELSPICRSNMIGIRHHLELYNIFKEKPDMSEEEFKEIAITDFLESFKKSGQSNRYYIILTNLTPIKEKFIFYISNYESREINVKY